jgi:hypothetical protein
VPPVQQTQSDETPTVHTERKRGRRKWFLGGFGVFLVLTTALGGAWLASATSHLAGALRVPVASTSPIGGRIFATGILPDGIDPADRVAVTRNTTVRRVCSVRSFRRATAIDDLTGWSFAVQPSLGEDRTFRCLAAHSGSSTASSSPVSTSAPG